MSKEEIFTDMAKCLELSNEKASVVEKLDMLYEKWAELSE